MVLDTHHIHHIFFCVIEFRKNIDQDRYTLFIYWFCDTLILISSMNTHYTTIYSSFYWWKSNLHKPNSSKTLDTSEKSLSYLFITTFTLIYSQDLSLKQQKFSINQQKLTFFLWCIQSICLRMIKSFTIFIWRSIPQISYVFLEQIEVSSSRYVISGIFSVCLDLIITS